MVQHLKRKTNKTSRLYCSADKVHDDRGRQLYDYPMELLNSLTSPGLPPHQLNLIQGGPIILLTKIKQGLVNGTRLIVKDLGDHVITAEVATGPLKGTTATIPKICMTPNEVEEMPFVLTRCQFPIRPAFAMTINKSQGQTLKRVGIY